MAEQTQLNEDLVTGYEPRVPEPMSDDEITAWLSLKISTAMGGPDGDVSETRQKNLDYYTGKPYGDERDGYSKVITMEGFEAVEWALPGLIRIFTSTKFAAFIPEGKNDMEAARQETDVVNEFIKDDTDMFEWCLAWMKDALIYPNGYLKVYVDEARDMRLVHHENMTEAQVAVIEQDPTLFSGTVQEAGTTVVLVPGPQGEPVPQEIPLFNVKARYVEPENIIRIEAVPPEEVLIDNDLRHVNLDKAEFIAHHREVTRSELVAMGYDRETVWSLPVSRELKHSTEREGRTDYHDEDPNYGEDTDSMMKLDLHECYAYLDTDDDGYAEYCRFLLVGQSELLEWEEWDYQPLIAISCFPQPHTHTGMSMMDVSKENQRVNSVLKRQILDNLYRTNRPRQFAGRGVNTEQLMNYVPHGVVEVDDVAQVQSEQIPVVVQQVMPFMEFVREELDRRTGVSRHAAGLDADTLASSTMGAYLESLGQATQRLEMLARNFAEVGFRQVALKVHHLLRTRQQKDLTTQVKGEWIDIDPRQWNRRKRMTVKVGTGTGSVKEKLSSAMTILNAQKEVMPFGLANAKGAYRALEDLAEALGKPVAEAYFVDPESQEYAAWAQQQEESAAQARQAEQAPQALAMQALRLEHMQAMSKTQLEAVKAKNEKELKIAQQLIDAAQKKDDQFLKAADIELTHQVDIEKVGVESDKVRQLRVSGE